MSELRTGGISALLHSLGLLIRLGFLVALMQFTSPSVIGYFGLLASIELVTIYLAGFEFHTFVARRHARSPGNARLGLLWSAHLKVLLPAIGAAVAFAYLGASLLALPLDSRGLLLLAILIACSTVLQEQGRYMVLMNKAERSIGLHFLRTAAWQPFVVPHLSSEGSVIFLILTYWSAFSLVGVIWGAWEMRTFRHRRVRPPAKYLREGLRRSIPYYGIAAITVAQGSVERFALQVFLGPSAVGYFTFFQSMANTVTSITQVSVGNVTYPKVLFEFGPRGHERLHYLRQVLRKTWFVVLLSSFVVLVATTTIVVGLSKLEYVAVMWLLFPLIIGQAVLAASQPLQVALFASHDDRFLLKLMATTGLLSIVLNVFLVPAFGLVGAATVPMSVAVLIGLARVIRVRRVISIA